MQHEKSGLHFDCSVKRIERQKKLSARSRKDSIGNGGVYHSKIEKAKRVAKSCSKLRESEAFRREMKVSSAKIDIDKESFIS